ncbi:uncharacterized protein SPPG_04020 [Spizellomyces punctatus DAOM BR117]|uniref:Uncharacterized protein n=1 Tax=Spizellomyces punctatus (strain DAOM BR117) TaxID=645134 RepID=A0A0L0HJ46_SPIPD|nr:uncharacterized protein SPPG_04020 [Spizellomyces punctatus DAOM BR117]KND00920.1 hypothetical protein SPPG_04020 [Spizellomyces punctatus DAOM BR117]|eukprot:XP_016608959.1 hypothetical protein SPPG_04020 [Spizellomyces punctatus DAOM BR117]
MPRRSHKGLAQICFLPTDPPWFQAHLITSDSSSLSILGTPAPPDAHPPIHSCCAPTPFWALRIREWQSDEEARCIVQQWGGFESDVVELSSIFVGCEGGQEVEADEGRVEFVTSLLKVEEDAEKHMKRYFRQLTPTTNATICLGQMSLENVNFQPCSSHSESDDIPGTVDDEDESHTECSMDESRHNSDDNNRGWSDREGFDKNDMLNANSDDNDADKSDTDHSLARPMWNELDAQF